MESILYRSPSGWIPTKQAKRPTEKPAMVPSDCGKAERCAAGPSPQAQRGIDKETAEYFGVAFFTGKGSMAGRVVIPIENERGEWIAYAGRLFCGPLVH